MSKVLTMLLVWLLYTVVVYKGCIEECCSPVVEDETTTAVIAPVEEEATRYPLDFQWDNATANINDGFTEVKQGILSGMTDDNILEVVGFYNEGEAKPADFENMGFARADEIRKLFLADIPEERIRLRARLNSGEGAKEGYFEASSINWVDAEKQAATLVELDDRIIIRFPTNSTKKHSDKAVDEYLGKLAERVKTSGESIQITGHTDNVGSADGNLRLSRKRAEKVQNILLSKGVDKSLISIDYKGETQPIASNDTESDRQENRRAEVRLVKSQE